MTKNKYLYRSLLFSSINSNNFCGFSSSKNDKNKKEQIQEQEQNQIPQQTPVQNPNQQEDKKQQLINECNDLIVKIKKLDPKFNKTVSVEKTYEELTKFKNELENDLKALEEKEKENKNKNPEDHKNPGDPKNSDKKLEKHEKENYINNIINTLKKTYNDVSSTDLNNNCCIYYCRFNEGDFIEKTDDKNNKVEKHYVYIYVSYLDNYKLIAKSKDSTSERVELDNNILKTDDFKFRLLGFKSLLWDSLYFKLGDFHSILEKFINLCDSEGILINKIREPLITISLKVSINPGSYREEYKNLWLGLINNNLYYETKSTNGKRLLIPIKDYHYERLNSKDLGFDGIYAYSNDDKEKEKIYFYKLERSDSEHNGSYIDIKHAPSDDFKIEKNNFKDICKKNEYILNIVN